MPAPAHRQPLHAGQRRPSGKAAFPLAKARDVRKAEHAGGVEIVADDGSCATQNALLVGILTAPLAMHRVYTSCSADRTMTSCCSQSSTGFGEPELFLGARRT
jgi:hypothetical protein